MSHTPTPSSPDPATQAYITTTCHAAEAASEAAADARLTNALRRLKGATDTAGDRYYQLAEAIYRTMPGRPDTREITAHEAMIDWIGWIQDAAVHDQAVDLFMRAPANSKVCHYAHQVDPFYETDEDCTLCGPEVRDKHWHRKRDGALVPPLALIPRKITRAPADGTLQ